MRISARGLKNLSISEGMLSRFNLSMIISFDGAHVHTSYVVYVHGGVH